MLAPDRGDAQPVSAVDGAVVLKSNVVFRKKGSP
jgi:hypothetical protein